MLLIDEDNAEAYLRHRGWVEAGERITVRRLSGGVSNEVLLVHSLPGRRPDFVLKQARPQLRVADPWFCGVERIWREVEVLRICETVLRRHDVTRQVQQSSHLGQLEISIPHILHEDQENFCFAMTAAPPEHNVWKQRLLGGEVEPGIAAACGRLLAVLHAGTWCDQDVARRLDDRQVFDELRLDPYYRTFAARRPDAALDLLGLVDSVWRHRLCLVHADFSPKNLLVAGTLRVPSTGFENKKVSHGSRSEPATLMMVDFETGHYGDPAFDVGFFLSHLALKAHFHAPRHEPYLQLADRFWEEYAAAMCSRLAPQEWSSLSARGMQNLAGCAWARLDGKSPVEYLTDTARRESVRAACRSLFATRPANWPMARDRFCV